MKETYISLEEVIPQGRIISQEEGIIEYKGIEFICGVNGLRQRKHLIELLDLLEIKGPCVVDLRFRTQVIVKEGPGFVR